MNSDGRSPGAASSSPPPIRLGLRANWRQFALLVVVNAFVGAMVGQERAVLPLLAEHDFGLASYAAALSFVLSFGAAKALANLAAGAWSAHAGRKPVLVTGWLVGLPVPVLLIWAPSWDWVVLANVLLGINQGLCWSTTVVMKIDLVGPSRRGLAMGLNEFAGYAAMSLAALASGYLAATYALRPHPFYLGLACAVAGLVLSVAWVRETRGHAREEATAFAAGPDGPARADRPRFWTVFARTSWRAPALFSASQAGLVNNLNDGVVWGLFPIYFAAAGAAIDMVGLMAAVYLGVWGVAQVGTGAVSDRFGRKPFIVGGMWVQALGITGALVTDSLALRIASMALLGLGTALVYPTLLATVADVAEPSWRAQAVGVYRLWRDTGYVVGALFAGALADWLGLSWAIGVVAGLTFASGVVALLRMPETLARIGGSGRVEKLRPL